jgi:hypothetical protein
MACEPKWATTRVLTSGRKPMSRGKTPEATVRNTWSAGETAVRRPGLFPEKRLVLATQI